MKTRIALAGGTTKDYGCLRSNYGDENEAENAEEKDAEETRNGGAEEEGPPQSESEGTDEEESQSRGGRGSSGDGRETEPSGR